MHRSSLLHQLRVLKALQSQNTIKWTFLRLTPLLVTHKELASLVWRKLIAYEQTTRGYEFELVSTLIFNSRAAAVAKTGKWTFLRTFDDVTSDLQGVSQSSMVQTVRLC